MFNFFGKNKKESGENTKVDPVREKREQFLKDYTLNLNTDDPAQNRLDEWVFDKRYTWGNIISPDGYCYLFKVDNSTEYMKNLIAYFHTIGIRQVALKVFSPEAGGVSQDQKACANMLQKFSP